MKVYPCDLLSIPDSAWAEDRFRVAYEFSVKKAIEMYGRDADVSTSTHYREHKDLVESTMRGAAGPYHMLTLAILAPVMPDQRTAPRLALLWMLLWDRFYASWLTPRAKDMVDGKDTLAPEFQHAYGQVFGPASTFHLTDFSHGPVGAFLHSQALRLGMAKAGTMPLGLLTGTKDLNSKQRRILEYWTRSERLPHNGWFKTGPHRAPKGPPTCDPGMISAYAKTYPWSRWSTLGDRLVYNWARACTVVIQELVAVGVAQRKAEETVLRLVAVDPVEDGIGVVFLAKGQARGGVSV
jgi:hypothetical protein